MRDSVMMIVDCANPKLAYQELIGPYALSDKEKDALVGVVADARDAFVAEAILLESGIDLRVGQKRKLRAVIGAKEEGE